MKIPRIVHAIGHIDDDLVSASAENKKKKPHWLKWSSLAACFALLVIAGAFILPSLLSGDLLSSIAADARYKNFSIESSDSAVIWPWEYLTPSEKYTSTKIDDIEYHSRGNTVSETLVGENIGIYTVVGYDEINNQTYTIEASAYKLNHISSSQFVAIKLEDSYYVFKNDEYAPPNTLGELLDQVALPQVVTLSRFAENGSTPGNKHYRLTDDDYVWNILSHCSDAPFIDDQNWHAGDREYISFTITSEPLGVYKVAMYITEDGYLWTNAFSWQYLFDIGEAAAKEIIQYAKQNSEKAAYEPYRNSITGTVVEITDSYLLVDDSLLCKNPEKGIVYQVLLNDLRLTRYVDYGVVTLGDTVQVSYAGDIEKENNIIDCAVSISNVVISGQDIFIPE
ncbi:MAG: hypothetical protein E7487_10040 [Ruminococcaceae bacterium]|nr:hypothetical protein [Oscillospiraceae bacterium]